MMFFTLSGLSGSVEVTLFPRGYQKYGELVQKDELVILEATVEYKTGFGKRNGNGNGGSGDDEAVLDERPEVKLLCERVTPLAKARAASAKRREEADKAITAPADEPSEDDLPPAPPVRVRRGPWLCLELHPEEMSLDGLRHLREVLARHPGPQSVALVFGANGSRRIIELGDETRIETTADLMHDLRLVAGVGYIYEDDRLRI